jgi:hypothetical protein
MRQPLQALPMEGAALVPQELVAKHLQWAGALAVGMARLVEAPQALDVVVAWRALEGQGC